MLQRQMVNDLRALGYVPAPSRVLEAVLYELELGDHYALLDTLLGPLYVAWNAHGISAVMRHPSGEQFEAEFRERFGRTARPAPEVPCDLGDKFDLRGVTAFERAVLLKALEIPRGEIRPYSWIAAEIGHPAAVRAVGTALARNPIPVFIPCHRVVRSDGHIGNYGLGGPDAKREILSLEGVEPDEIERLARAGVRFVGNATDGSFCFPTCRHARRISASDRVAFKSPESAQAAGYRPCTDCRPARALVAHAR
jgi:O-6-methylguanine DNA methyltransferase